MDDTARKAAKIEENLAILFGVLESNECRDLLSDSEERARADGNNIT